jgi:hypothetical protein
VDGNQCHYLHLLIPEKEIKFLWKNEIYQNMEHSDTEYMLELGCKTFEINRIPLIPQQTQ